MYTWMKLDCMSAPLCNFFEGKFIFTEPKSAHSRRNIGLPRVTVDALRAHKKRQEEERTFWGDAWDDSLDLVFPNTVGKPMNASNIG
jgi:integrase